jgi:phenylacetate-coenzyme A ligase PaaK-like adenylate-forming protein
LIDRVINGENQLLLNDQPVYWTHTKGTTGESKFFPCLPSYLSNFVTGYRRAIYSYSIFNNDYDWLSGKRLSLSSSGNLGKMGNPELSYGYSASVAIGFLDKINGLPDVIPSQEELDVIHGESTKDVWEKRYDFAFQKAKNSKITHLTTAPNVLIGFAEYIKKVHNVYPKDVWEIKLIITGGAPGGNTHLAPSIEALFGKKVNIREIYISTEGMYGAQMDEKSAWCPLYDLTFLEVQTINGIKQLHDMYPGEIGSLIISNDYLPRYRTNDLILAFEPPYFRCIGREYTKLHPYSFGELKGKSALVLDESKNLPSWR